MLQLQRCHREVHGLEYLRKQYRYCMGRKHGEEACVAWDPTAYRQDDAWADAREVAWELTAHRDPHEKAQWPLHARACWWPMRPLSPVGNGEARRPAQLLRQPAGCDAHRGLHSAGSVRGPFPCRGRGCPFWRAMSWLGLPWHQMKAKAYAMHDGREYRYGRFGYARRVSPSSNIVPASERPQQR